MKTDNVIATLGNYQLSYRHFDEMIDAAAHSQLTTWHTLLSISILLSIVHTLIYINTPIVIIIAIVLPWLICLDSLNSFLGAFKITTIHPQHKKCRIGINNTGRKIWLTFLFTLCALIRHLFTTKAPTATLIGTTLFLCVLALAYYAYVLFELLFIKPNAVVAQAADTSLAHDG